jgi:hypothetical protein
MYWRVCLFWNLYISHRKISLSCGRQKSFDIQVGILVSKCHRSFTIESMRSRSTPILKVSVQ